MNTAPRSSDPALTQREKEILTCIASGMCSKEIAERLRIAENTVTNHRCNMLRKTGARSSAELIHCIRNFAN